MTNLALRERRHQQAKDDVAKLEDRREKLLDQLTRTNTKLKAARKSVERYERPPAQPKKKVERGIGRVLAEPAPAPKPTRTPKPKAVSQPIDRELNDEVAKLIGHPPVNPVKSEEAKLAAAARMRAELARETESKRRRRT